MEHPTTSLNSGATGHHARPSILSRPPILSRLRPPQTHLTRPRPATALMIDDDRNNDDDHDDVDLVPDGRLAAQLYPEISLCLPPSRAASSSPSARTGPAGTGRTGVVGRQSPSHPTRFKPRSSVFTRGTASSGGATSNRSPASAADEQGHWHHGL